MNGEAICKGCGLTDTLRHYETRNDNALVWCSACGTMMIFWKQGAGVPDYRLPSETSKPALLMTEKIRISLSERKERA